MNRTKETDSLEREPRLRRGYTTGTCAAAAAKAAAAMLFSGEQVFQVQLTVPAGETLLLDIVDITKSPDQVRCAVVKDAGDDPDVTNGMKVFASVRRTQGVEILIDGGEGVGRVTKPGLDQPPGSAAINSVPRRMILQAVQEEKIRCGETCGIEVVISIPGGEAIAKHTLNPVLGIEGGLSVLGTSGIVEPMSEKALIDTIAVTIRQRLALGDQVLIMAPGNYGTAFLRDNCGVSAERVVKISNYVGESFDIARQEHVRKVLLAGHIGKLVKVAGGIMNTHSAVADRRMEILAEHARRSGADAQILQAIGKCVTTEAALDVLDAAGIFISVTESLVQSIQEQISRRTCGNMQVEVILFSSVRGKLAQTAGTEALLQEMASERSS